MFTFPFTFLSNYKDDRDRFNNKPHLEGESYTEISDPNRVPNNHCRPRDLASWQGGFVRQYTSLSDCDRLRKLKISEKNLSINGGGGYSVVVIVMIHNMHYTLGGIYDRKM